MTDQENRKKLIYEDRNYTSEQISNLSRYIGFGLIAITFVIVTGQHSVLNVILQKYRIILGLVALSGILTIIFDYLQYVSGSLSSKKAARRTDQRFLVDRKSMYFKLRVFFYQSKQVTSIVGSILLLVIFAITFFISES